MPLTDLLLTSFGREEQMWRVGRQPGCMEWVRKEKKIRRQRDSPLHQSEKEKSWLKRAISLLHNHAVGHACAGWIGGSFMRMCLKHFLCLLSFCSKGWTPILQGLSFFFARKAGLVGRACAGASQAFPCLLPFCSKGPGWIGQAGRRQVRGSSHLVAPCDKLVAPGSSASRAQWLILQVR
eukprot:1160585-Pelagomonas_calceolata.AAC.6